MKIMFLIISVISLLCFVECTKNKNTPSDNPYGLPNATQIGANVFACLVNGRKFIAGSEPFYMNGSQFTNDTLYINGGIQEPLRFEGISFFIKHPTEIGIYKIDSASIGAVYTTDSTCLGVSSHATTSFSRDGYIDLAKFDTLNKIVSGTFSCDFSIPNCDTLHITEGRFDFRLY
jgi:hypothetical protein